MACACVKLFSFKSQFTGSLWNRCSLNIKSFLRCDLWTCQTTSDGKQTFYSNMHSNSLSFNLVSAECIPFSEYIDIVGSELRQGCRFFLQISAPSGWSCTVKSASFRTGRGGNSEGDDSCKWRFAQRLAWMVSWTVAGSDLEGISLVNKKRNNPEKDSQ